MTIAWCGDIATWTQSGSSVEFIEGHRHITISPNDVTSTDNVAS